MELPNLPIPVKFWVWCVVMYVPRVPLGTFVVRRPVVYDFNAASNSTFVAQLQQVNTFRPTAWCRVMTKYGSDKGCRSHNYTTVYSALFESARGRPFRIFELGLGTNNKNFPFNMGPNGYPGASLLGWRDLFPLASIYGADIDRDILFQDDRIKTYFCDQLNPTAIRDLWAEPDL